MGNNFSFAETPRNIATFSYLDNANSPFVKITHNVEDSMMLPGGHLILWGIMLCLSSQIGTGHPVRRFRSITEVPVRVFVTFGMSVIEIYFTAFANTVLMEYKLQTVI